MPSQAAHLRSDVGVGRSVKYVPGAQFDSGRHWSKRWERSLRKVFAGQALQTVSLLVVAEVVLRWPGPQRRMGRQEVAPALAAKLTPRVHGTREQPEQA